MSRIGVMTGGSGRALRRCFGSWSERYRRFTSNLSSPTLKVRVLEPGEKPSGGIPCVVHWVKSEDLVRTGKGSVCSGDGWPVSLWRAFLEELPDLPGDTVAGKLSSFLDSQEREDELAVSSWRKAVEAGRVVEPTGASWRGWLPVPARLVAGGRSGTCVFSWSPESNLYDSLSEALRSPEARLMKPDPESQARYYAECALAKLHGVSFEETGDSLEDESYSRRPAVERVLESLSRLEAERVADRSMGTLDRFGGQ
ncbi:MAG: hypothetical protein JRM86_01530 [Nitrososphaerota archaeon]|nr:hypothetical protein [Nitrososphaerota archaeon]MDG7005596.1 hypothetical protein [Nitrososphaerota archaeon]MDG7020645.1 hypothetical protein [Nitrososphaerota archaeon]